jgi:hypothetical protein
MKHLLSNFGQRFSAQTHLEIKQLQAVRILPQSTTFFAYRFLTHQLHPFRLLYASSLKGTSSDFLFVVSTLFAPLSIPFYLAYTLFS